MTNNVENQETADLVSELENNAEAGNNAAGELHEEENAQADNESENNSSEGEGKSSEGDESSASENKKIEFTQEELDKQIARAKAIAERKARRQIDEKYRQELDKIIANTSHSNQQQMPPQQYSYNVPPNDNMAWDDVLGWIDKSLTREQYSAAVKQAIESYGGQNAGNQNYQTAQPMQYAQPVNNQYQAQQPANSALLLSEKTRDQIDECHIDIPEFKEEMLDGANNKIISVPMLNAAAQSPTGIKDMYELLKNDPKKLIKISRLSPQDQMAAILQHNIELSEKRAPKVKTQVSKKSEPLKNSGSIDDGMDEFRKKKLRSFGF